MVKLIIGVVLMLFPNIFEAKSVNGGKDKYSATFIIPKSDIETIDKIKSAIGVVYNESQAKLRGRDKNASSLSTLKSPLKDGDVERPDDDFYADSYFINAYSGTQPGIVNLEREEITNQDEIYSGVYVRASIEFYAYNVKGNKGIACRLLNIQKVSDNDLFGNKEKPQAADDFDDGFTLNDESYM